MVNTCAAIREQDLHQSRLEEKLLQKNPPLEKRLQKRALLNELYQRQKENLLKSNHFIIFNTMPNSEP